ncbi:uncharacterized protein IL334_006625 [Kwoniella shivajii]|uniref:Uncharacterized protein n=1 Tax=Kwoniella shivajii TaxID=564305 RepID=A0ABZ1D9H9_9TREE|nr:hypothetical protein IL334_006625 [Kwoniella shivajii]
MTNDLVSGSIAQSSSSIGFHGDTSEHQVSDLSSLYDYSMKSDPQILLILVGLPGSGKTTFSEALASQSREITNDHQQVEQKNQKVRRWIRASQDEAPNRRRQECESRVKWGLDSGYNVVVDRVDFDPVQRSHFISIADTYTPKPKIYCLILIVSNITLEKRLLNRPDHPTIPNFETGLRVLRQMGPQYQPPSCEQGGSEGFDKILELQEIDQPLQGIWTANDIQRVLERIEFQGRNEIGHRMIIPSTTNVIHRGRGNGRGQWTRGRGTSTTGWNDRRGNDWSRGRGGIYSNSNISYPSSAGEETLTMNENSNWIRSKPSETAETIDGPRQGSGYGHSHDQPNSHRNYQPQRLGKQCDDQPYIIPQYPSQPANPPTERTNSFNN